ncbi:hypothetical protein OC834_006668 [Tilletia horrida]|uniref:Uncharacterized protein n=1 Tax=Tilletia horrida TaxID=155126 RepID=A0AAN6GH46_9BASI|nr:hypothetical protein OC834_006668 [Tilletia horrida]KAK0527622.1 hypothetical protein OC835_004918 [Tilletia horrida]KAK0537300.1 hypothetical protein OC842_001670 [Tilletia horrida]
MPPPPPPSYKSSKWPTHATISADIILGDAESDNFVHDVEATFYDDDDTAHNGNLNVWSREVPSPGIYLVNNAPFSTEDGIQISINDGATYRRIPEGYDGLDGDGATLPVVRPLICGIGVVVWVSEDRKSCLIAGWTYINKKALWKKYLLSARFEAGVRWDPWYVAGLRFKVYFECVLTGRREDGMIDTYIRRMTQLEAAPQALLTSLDIGTTKQTDRAAKYKAIREKRAAETKRQQESAQEEGEPMSTPDLRINGSNDIPAAPKSSKGGIAPQTPSSPTTGLLTRKRARMDGC